MIWRNDDCIWYEALGLSVYACSLSHAQQTAFCVTLSAIHAQKKQQYDQLLTVWPYQYVHKTKATIWPRQRTQPHKITSIYPYALIWDVSDLDCFCFKLWKQIKLYYTQIWCCRSDPIPSPSSQPFRRFGSRQVDSARARRTPICFATRDCTQGCDQLHGEWLVCVHVEVSSVCICKCTISVRTVFNART